jgi:hypothetical protein
MWSAPARRLGSPPQRCSTCDEVSAAIHPPHHATNDRPAPAQQCTAPRSLRTTARAVMTQTKPHHRQRRCAALRGSPTAGHTCCKVTPWWDPLGWQCSAAHFHMRPRQWRATAEVVFRGPTVQGVYMLPLFGVLCCVANLSTLLRVLHDPRRLFASGVLLHSFCPTRVRRWTSPLSYTHTCCWQDGTARFSCRST